MIAGLSAIYRCNQTVAQDGTPAGITLTYADRFCLDGKRLRLTSSENLSAYGDDGTTYQTERADFSNVTAHGAAGNGPAYFTVQARNGWTYEYGNTSDSRVLGNGSTAFDWMLDKVTDRSGNTMVIAWKPADQNLTGTTLPASIEWTPSSYGSSTYNYTMQFNYQVLPLAVKAGYLAGEPVENFYALTSIQIESTGSTVKDYFLKYSASNTTGRQTLTSLEECADSAQTKCLQPTTFTYQAGQAGLGGATTLVSSSAPLGAPAAAYDFNGDGRNDLAWYQNGAWQVAFATSSGYSAPINTGIIDPYALKDSVDGSGTDGFLAQVSGTWWWYTWNGSSFTGTNTGIALDTTTAGSFALADVNGDGLPDLITTRADGYLYVRLNTSTAGAVSFSSSVIRTVPAPLLISSTYGTRRADFSGTGQQDLFALILTTPPNSVEETVVLHFTDNTFLESQAFFGAPVDVADYNDDGCSDMLFSGELVISACNGAPAQTISLSQPAVAGLDWDGDGRRDVIVNNNGTLGVYLSIGTGLSSTLLSTGIPYSTGTSYTVSHNATGDGLDALVVESRSGPYTINYYLHNGARTPPDLLSSATDGYGNSVKPVYTSIVQGAYSNYSFSSPSYPYQLYLAPLYVVSGATFSDPSNPPSGTYSQSYSYIGSWKNMQGRGFSNFMNIETYDSRNKVWRLDCYENKFPFSGTHVCTQLSLDQAGNQLIRESYGNHALTTLDGTADNERYFTYFNVSKDFKYQVSWSASSGSSTGPLIETDSTTYQYDNYGNATNVTDTRTDNDSNSPYVGDTWTTTTTSTPQVDTSSWCLPLLSEVQVTYSSSIDSPSVTRTRDYTPDTNKCRYTQVVTEPSSSQYQATEAFTFDSFGNLATDIVTGINMPARETTLNWGTVTGQFPLSVTDASGAQTQLNYNYDYGLLSSRTDANGRHTSWQYDSFGRLTQQTHPDGTATTLAYTACSANNYCPGSSKMEITQTNLDVNGAYINDIQMYPDALDRPIQQFTRTLNNSGSTYSFEYWSYDALGRLTAQGMPCLTAVCNTAQATTYSYDAIDRLTQMQRPISANDSSPATTSYAYAGRSTTITDANGNARTLVRDLRGLLRETKDATGYTVKLGYDAAGSHTATTDSLGNSLWSGTVQYGIAPFTTAATDADLGSWSYTYDALGELKGWKDAKGQTFSALYDALSRLTDRYEPGLYTHWTWGSSGSSHNWGELASVCTGTGSQPTQCSSSGYAESETYDAHGRPYQRSITIPGDASYTYTWQYNATTGLLDTLTYPTSTSGFALVLKYGYQNGILHSLTDQPDNVTLWTGNATDGRGNYIQETLGNGVAVNHAIDLVTGLPSSITAGLNGGTGLQNNSYLFDSVGNLIQRQDNNAGTTENVYYDALNRLSHTVGDTSTQLSYDYMGRLATWEAYGNSTNTKDYTTQQAGCTYYANAQPHAVRKNTQGSWPPTSFCYDANGNLLTESASGTVDRSTTWMSFNQPNKITAPALNSSSQFLYDQNHERYEQIASYSGSPENTEYIGGLLEKMTNSSGTAYRYYVPAGNNFIVYNRWTSGTNALDYVTEDHLGSTAVITDQAGALVVDEKFSALGWNENTSTQEAKMATITRHEFTGHEGLDNNGLGLVNMDGRVYNSSGSMFLSPDPNIPDPTDTRDYDRYAYVDHNPLTLIDPSGFDDVCFDHIGHMCTLDTVTVPGTPYPPDEPGTPYAPPPPPPGPGGPTPPFTPGTAPTLQTVVVTGHRPKPITLQPDVQFVQFTPDFGPSFGMPMIPSSAFPTQQTKPNQPQNPTQCPNGAEPSIQNNPHVGRNIAGGMLAFGSIGATIYTVVALANLEDGGGEVMLALRAAQLARNGEAMMNAADFAQGAARMGGMSDAGLAALSGGALLSPLGAAAGAIATTAKCPEEK